MIPFRFDSADKAETVVAVAVLVDVAAVIVVVVVKLEIFSFVISMIQNYDVPARGVDMVVL